MSKHIPVVKEPQDIRNITATLSIPVDTLSAVEDRIVEKLFNKLKPFLQSVKSEDEQMTVEEAAAFLIKSKAQIYQWVNNARHGLGDFPYRKAGRSLRFSKKELIQWMEKNSQIPLEKR